MTISNGEECNAAIHEIGELLRQRPPLQSPKGRRLIWLAKELKDWLLAQDGADPHLAKQQDRARTIWSDVNRMLARWH